MSSQVSVPVCSQAVGVSAPPVPIAENRSGPPVTEQQEVTHRRKRWLVTGLLGCASLLQAQEEACLFTASHGGVGN